MHLIPNDIASYTRCIPLVLVIAAANAQAIETDDKAARKSFEEGVQAFREARVGDALNAFKRAYAERPSFRILYNIAQAEAELGHPHRAIEAFEAYLADGGNRIPKARVIAVQSEIERLRTLVGEVMVKGPRGAEVWIDGEREGYLPLAAPIVLPTGRHRLIVRHGKSAPCEQDIVVKGGENTEEGCFLLDYKLDLDRLAAQDKDAGPASSIPLDGPSAKTGDEAKGRGFWSTVAPWIATGFATVALATGSICAIKTSTLNASLKAECGDGVCPPSRQDDVDALSGWAGAADGLFVATAIFTGAAITLFIAPWEKDRETGPQ
ncbi:MAG: hypothetical protein QNJ97_19440 [Myxococcota bacterium]|nr:hypothetical protein [Myxococcota bacterium]